MANNLNYSYKNPASGDVSGGSGGWFTIINSFVARMVNHRHDDLDSVKLGPEAIDTSEQILTTTDNENGHTYAWTGPTAGYHTLTVTIPDPYTDTTQINFQIRDSSDEIITGADISEGASVNQFVIVLNQKIALKLYYR